MFHPEIIFLRSGNNPSPKLQQASMLSKLILNKTPKKGKATTPDLDSLAYSR
ncbi:hypothetical protein PHLH5_09140 [Pseudomonas sp. Cab53]|nr:hypothetical protein PHLH5_09140 [Pseudomonas sp. Cab53]